MEESLPRTYHVTLAAALPEEPDWIVSTFVASQPFTVTPENQGQFEATWDGLDENGMPAPPGDYVIKGIYLPAQDWPVGGETRAIAPRYLMGVGDSWTPRPEGDAQRVIIGGHQFGFIRDVAARDDGKAMFFSGYIESYHNPFVVDLHREIGYEQVVHSFPSHGGLEGGWAVAIDEDHYWVANAWGWIIRADSPWGGETTPTGLHGVTAPGTVVSLESLIDPDTGSRRLYAAIPMASGNAPLNEVRIYDGNTAALLQTLTLDTPTAVTLDRRIPGSRLYALHKDPAGVWAVSGVDLKDGLPVEGWQVLFTLPQVRDPSDLASASDGGFYLADMGSDRVLCLSPQGEVIGQLGKDHAREPGPFAQDLFFTPSRLSVWRKAEESFDRVLVVEAGPTGRVSEWTSQGTFLRQWFLSRTAVNGYCIDPENPEHLYLAGGGGMMRFKIDYENNTWQPDAVYPDLTQGVGNFPQIIVHQGKKYLCFGGSQGDGYRAKIYRWESDRWIASAATVFSTDPSSSAAGRWWSDANGDGQQQEDEFGAINDPVVPTSWWGNWFLDDLTLVCPAPQDPGAPAWLKRGYLRIKPHAFDAHGNPVYRAADMERFINDPIHEALSKRYFDPSLPVPFPAQRGGNEVVNPWHGGWGSLDGEPDGPLYMSIGYGPPNPGGLDFGGGRTSHEKLMRFDPQPDGSYRMRWRVGRKAWRIAQRGEAYSFFFTTKPAHGIVGIQDQNGVYHLYTQDGLYVDTLMWDGFARGSHYGNHYSHGGEMWFGRHFLNRDNGKVYLLMGRSAANVYELAGWTADAIKPVTLQTTQVALRAGDIAPANPFALVVRGGHGAAKVALFQPATGGAPSLDGSMTGWESALPVVFALNEERRAEARVLYDREHLYLRWHVRTPTPAPLRPGVNTRRMFAHNLAADTLSFYLQGDPNAAPSREESRPGDARYVIGFQQVRDGMKPLLAAMYHDPHGERPTPMTFRSPVRQVTFGHVAEIKDAPLSFTMDPDGKGYVITAALPRSHLPAQLPALDASLTTLVDFSVTLGGTQTFWWANTAGLDNALVTDEPAEAMFYPGSWAQARFAPVQSLPIRAWLVSGPWGGPELPQATGWDEGHALAKRIFENTTYPPDTDPLDPRESYESDLTLDQQGHRHRVGWRVVPTSSDGTLTLDAHKRQLHFLTAYVHAPQAMTLPITLLAPGGPFGGSRLLVNGQAQPGEARGDYGVMGEFANAQQITLQQGWNQITLRCYWLWDSMRASLVLHGPPDVLWSLKATVTPPAAP